MLNSNMRKSYTYIIITFILIIALFCPKAAIADLKRSSLHPPSFSHDLDERRRALAEFYIRDRLITLAKTESDFDFLENHGTGVYFLGSGHYLINREHITSYLDFIRVITRLDFICLLHTEKNTEKNYRRYNSLRRKTVGNAEIMDLYQTLTHGKKPKYFTDTDIFNDLIARAFELLHITEEALVDEETELLEEERRFLALLKPLLTKKRLLSDKYKYFPEEYFDIDKRSETVKAEQNKRKKHYDKSTKRSARSYLRSDIKYTSDNIIFILECEAERLISEIKFYSRFIESSTPKYEIRFLRIKYLCFRKKTKIKKLQTLCAELTSALNRLETEFWNNPEKVFESARAYGYEFHPEDDFGTTRTGGVKDYYGILGIEETADQTAIKKAYRALARKCHPDILEGAGKSAEEIDRATEQFKEATEAHEVLSDPDTKRRYDQQRASSSIHSPDPAKRMGETSTENIDALKDKLQAVHAYIEDLKQNPDIPEIIINGLRQIYKLFLHRVETGEAKSELLYSLIDSNVESLISDLERLSKDRADIFRRERLDIHDILTSV